MALTNTFNDQQWLISLHRALTEWMETEVNNFIKQGVTPVGLDIYELEFSFPPADQLARLMPLGKTLIHFQVDDIENRKLGFGDDVVNWTVNPSAPTVAGLVIEHEATCHLLNFDVGVWTSDKAGGVTARLQAHQMLDTLFSGPSARIKFQKDTHGIEVVSFNGGRFIQEEISGTIVYRTVDSELILRCYSRKINDPATLVDGIDLTGGISISDELILDVSGT